jgi:hypothetical protein
LLWLVHASARAESAPTNTPPAWGARPAEAAVKPVGPGQFEIGNVRLDSQQRLLRFPALLNLKEGLVEYLIVTTTGKTHESVLRTEAEPFHIHTAMLLLGVKTPATNAADKAGPFAGDKLTIEVTWRAGTQEQTLRAEELVFNTATQSPMTPGPWNYRGSRIVDGVFLAQQDGSVVALITDEAALVHNPRPGYENDEIWQVNRIPLPPLNTSMTVTFRLEAPKPTR